MGDAAEQISAAPMAAGDQPVPIPGLPQIDPPQQPRTVGTEDVVRLFSFFTSEFRSFLAHVEQAVQTFQTTGALPTQPLYRAVAVDLPPAPKPEPGATGGGSGGPGPGRPRKVKRDKIVRKPTAFNHFVKEKIGQYKADGVTIPDDRNNNELFKRAVSEWSALNPEQKKAYGEAYRAAHPEAVAGHDGGGDGAGHDDAAAMEAQAQLLLDGAAEAQAAAGTKRKAPGIVGAAQLEHLPPPGTGHGDLEDEHISLSELVTGGEDPETAAAAAEPPPIAAAAPPKSEEAEEGGRKKRKGTSIKSKP